MKKSIVFIFTVFLLGSCAVFTPRQEFQQGMSERKFLRQNRDAVMSNMEGPFITYRVNRGERFYILATFENKELIKIEEREISPAWMPAQPSENKE
ncbi:hypothetical protein [Belliella pelovolcani]|uniref:Lipoprotein n=1 Tax=Belliella pelovolcani TaxID=529505 RepID=A0A1N7LFA1_9BACT|nr:hypothetical protein [Belliella pelovolcani]SIS72505.1 hypothetical protein SAMN05421761_103288 [Belliella pelovolcani]